MVKLLRRSDRPNQIRYDLEIDGVKRNFMFGFLQFDKNPSTSNLSDIQYNPEVSGNSIRTNDPRELRAMAIAMLEAADLLEEAQHDLLGFRYTLAKIRVKPPVEGK